MSNHQEVKAGKKEPAPRLGRSNVPTFGAAPRRIIYNKSGEEMFDLNDPSVYEENVGEMPGKSEKIATFISQIQRFFRCDDQKHHGCCYIAPPNSSSSLLQRNKHYQMDNNLQWSMAKILVSKVATQCLTTNSSARCILGN